MHVREWLGAYRTALKTIESLDIKQFEYELPSGALVSFRVYPQMSPKIHVDLKGDQGAGPWLDARLEVLVTDRSKHLRLSELSVADLRRVAELREPFESWLAGKVDELPTRK